MTLENKKLLLVDLSARLPYGLVVELDEKFGFNKGAHSLVKELLDPYCVEGIKPYLRPMSSMNEEEKKEFQACHCVYELHPDFQPMMCNLANELNMFDWLNAHHFDYRGLIEKGLALEAPKGMYDLQV
jgi:hypothetical protein